MPRTRPFAYPPQSSTATLSAHCPQVSHRLSPPLWISRLQQPLFVAPATDAIAENVVAQATQKRSGLRNGRCARTAPCAARARNPPRGRAAAGRSPASDRQTLAALGAARLDDGTSATRLHANEKTVRAGAADFGGLIGAFHAEGPMPGATARQKSWKVGRRACRVGTPCRESAFCEAPQGTEGRSFPPARKGVASGCESATLTPCFADLRETQH